jgi:periplasmic divalent cation tolerance protein
MDLLAVYTTVATRDDACTIARALVERRLAACVQIEPIESFYRWQGEIVQEPEYRLLAKTTERGYAAVEAAIRDLHPYALPAIHAVGLEEVHAPYARWVIENSDGA